MNILFSVMLWPYATNNLVEVYVEILQKLSHEFFPLE